MQYADGWPCLLEVPLDSEMDVLARKWAASSDATIRWNAALILRHAKSPLNIPALRQIADSKSDSSEGLLSQALATDQLESWGQPLPVDRTSAAAMTVLWQLYVAAMIVFLISAGICLPRSLRTGGLAPYRRMAFANFGFILLLLWIGSYFEGLGFIVGHVEAAVCKGQVVVVHREHAAIVRAEPFRFVTDRALLAVRGYFHGNYENHHSALPRLFGDGWFDGEKETMPLWSRLQGIAIPFWAMIATAVLIPLMLRAIHRARRLMDNRRRGFQVLLPSRS